MKGPLDRCAELRASDPAAAAAQLRALLEEEPLNSEAYRLLALALKPAWGTAPAADGPPSPVTTANMSLMRAEQALMAGDLPTAEIILRERLLHTPDDATALALLGVLATKLGYDDEAEQLLRLALETSPGLIPAQMHLASLLHRRNRPEEAVPILDDVLRRNGNSLPAWNMKAAALARAGRPEEADAAYRESLARNPKQGRIWSHYGNLLKTMGRRDESHAALRTAVELMPDSGEAWLSLAELKTTKLSGEDVSRLEQALARQDLRSEDRCMLHFALGKALEQAGDAAAAFEQYDRGNRLRRSAINYDPDLLSSFASASARTFTRRFFDQREGSGAPVPGPIFIVGMTRSGSTLIEQILASHPQVEGTFELPTMPELASSFTRAIEEYPAAIEQADAGRLRDLGERYLEMTRRYRQSEAPFFVDKMPLNWMHVPLIHLALPNARIIDARRHPLACCFSNYKQYFRSGQEHTHDLSELGRYYADYVRFMAHIDRVLPRRVHRVIHERLLEEPEGEIRRLLEHVELPFHAACLRFHETRRTVRTASADQVREPLNTGGTEQWRKFEQWLEPLKQALGQVLASYPEAPELQSR